MKQKLSDKNEKITKALEHHIKDVTHAVESNTMDYGDFTEPFVLYCALLMNICCGQMTLCTADVAPDAFAGQSYFMGNRVGIDEYKSYINNIMHSQQNSIHRAFKLF